MPAERIWAPQPPARGSSFGVPGYSGLAEIARGGESVVYRAREDSIGRSVAIKVLTVADDAGFRRELAITTELGSRHPNIVNVLATTTASDGRPCLVMEYHELGSAYDRLRALGPGPISEVVAAGTAVADALAFAHSRGVIHRDVKPQNILLLPTSYVLADFGIARPHGLDHTGTADRFSYRYASPQVLDGFEPTAADDCWSLGATLFTLLAGFAPFAADDPADDTALAYLRRVRLDQRRSWPERDVPAGLVDVVARCLEPDPDRRTITAAGARDALAAIPTESRAWARPAPAGVARAGPGDRPAAPGRHTGPTADLADPDAHRRPPAAPVLLADGGSAPPHLLPGGGYVPSPTSADPDGEQTQAAEPPTPSPAAAAVRRRAGTAALAALAAVAIVGLGWLGLLQLRPQAPAAGHTAPASTTITRIPTDIGSLPLNPNSLVEDPAIAPTGIVAVDHGTTMDLQWTDRSDGRAQTLIVDTTKRAADGSYVLHGMLRPGVTMTTIAVPRTERVCVILVAVVTDGGAPRRGASDPFCPARR